MDDSASKKNKFSILLMVFALSAASCGERQPMLGVTHVIYGDDNQHDLASYPKDSALHGTAESVAIVITSNLIESYDENKSFISSVRTFGQSRKASGQPLCMSERFQEQTDLMGTCSAFLIGPDIVASAGHCFPSDIACKSMSFIFGVGYDLDTTDVRIVPRDHVFHCKQIIANGMNNTTDPSDYALIQLDRKAVGLHPLNIRHSGTLKRDTPLTLIGYPNSLPLKISENGHQLPTQSPSWFSASLDSFNGSSGSPVLNTKTLTVEGILIGGADDFIQTGSCWSTHRCRDDGSDCEGETVTRINEVSIIFESKMASGTN